MAFFDDMLMGLMEQRKENDPFAIPRPNWSEMLLRTLSGALPPPGRLMVPNTAGGRVLGTLARLAGSGAGVLGGEMEERRRDPLQRILKVGEAAQQAAQGIRVPETRKWLEPGMTGSPAETIPTLEPPPPPSALSPERLSLTGTRETPPSFGLFPAAERPSIAIPAIPPQTRGASSLSEAFTRGTPEQRKAVLAAKSLGIGDLIFEPQKFESLAPGATLVRTTASGGVEPLYRTEERPTRPTRPTDFQTILDAVSQAAGHGDYASVPPDQKQSIVQKARAAQQAPERPGEEEHRKASTAEIKARTRRINEAADAAKDPNATREKLTTQMQVMLRDYDLAEKSGNKEALVVINGILQDLRKRMAKIAKEEPPVLPPSRKTPVPNLPGWSFEGR